MQEKHVFEYAVIRVVPRVEREEFINVGVVVFCKRKKFLDCLYKLDTGRLVAISPGLELEELEKYLDSFKRICTGSDSGGPIAALEPAERFRWLTAVRSTVLQTSRVHPGLCHNPHEVLDRLFEQLVL